MIALARFLNCAIVGGLEECLLLFPFDLNISKVSLILASLSSFSCMSVSMCAFSRSIDTFICDFSEIRLVIAALYDFCIVLYFFMTSAVAAVRRSDRYEIGLKFRDPFCEEFDDCMSDVKERREDVERLEREKRDDPEDAASSDRESFGFKAGRFDFSAVANMILFL